jgi:CRISPR-associated protein Cas1
MANLYLTEQGAVLHKHGERLVVTKDKVTLLDVPCHEIDAVLLFGSVQITTAAVRELMEQGIEMALLTRRGRLLCQLTPPMAKNVPLRLAQYERSKDAQFALAFARTVVGAKVRNGLGVARQYAYNYKGHGLESELRELEAHGPRIDAVQTAGELFGVEGNAARTYFSAFGKMIRTGLIFPGRRKRPAPDPINALLSFGYTLLFNEIASLLDGVGFDPYIGFFHKPDYGRPSLAADLVEEFRAPVIDRLTLRLINTRVFDAGDFYAHPSSGSMYLKRESLAKYFTQYEAAVGEPETGMDGPIDPGTPSPPTEGTSRREKGTAQKAGSVRALLRRQVYRLQRTLLDGVPYEPFQLDVKTRP